jgi:UDP-2-acetamido-2,6-beta-L-arabino-hexul-4-ose reductase
MKIAVIGGGGFLGWHTRCRAFARGVESIAVPRETATSAERLALALGEVDAVVHCAGVTRASDAEVTDGNLALARALAEAVGRLERRIRIVYANSVHAHAGTVYGIAKAQASAILATATPEYSDVLLPNLFGEHGRPHHNSFVATFCHEIAAGHSPAHVVDRDIALLHAQDAATVLLREAGEVGERAVEPKATLASVREVLQTLTEADAIYRHGDLPDIADAFRMSLFNTYRSYLFPYRSPLPLTKHSDARGTLFECLRSGYAGGQAFISTTEPGAVRGQHVHLRKLERFVALDGTVTVALRRLFHPDVVEFELRGDAPVALDIPTMWAHKLANTGARPATVFFWSNEVYRPEDPDTFPIAVEQEPS